MKFRRVLLFGRNALSLRGVGCIAVLALFCASANAREFELRGADLRVVGDTQWTGGGWGGYHPIRLEITNFGPGREVELLFAPHERGRGTPTVRRRLRIEQNATARVTLAVPLVGGRNSGRFDVRLDGVGVPGLNVDLALAPPGDGEYPQASLLIVSSDEVDTRGFEIAIASAAQMIEEPGVPRGHFLSRRMGRGEARIATVEPAMLPASWIDYTAVDVVAIRLDVLESLRSDERAALFDWVATGGRLIVDRIGAEPAESERLRELLPTVGDRELGWRTASGGERRPIVVPFHRMPGDAAMIPDEGSPLPFARDMLPREVRRQFERLEEAIVGQSALPMAEPTWPVEPSPFFLRRIGFGRVAAVSGDVFTASGADWSWLLRELGGSAITWPVRHGMSSGRGDLEFINQPIPGVRGVPSAAFLTLITLFTLAIGPLNYVLLWRRKQLSRLVVTVPALAAVTSLLLFGYAAISQGFTTQGRVRSVTLLDPATNTATTVSRIALFAGMAPSSGLKFSNATAVYPLYPYQEEFIDGDVDWTDSQTLTGGWLRSRTRTQFVTVSRRDERGRLDVTKTRGGLRVVNGFEVPLTYLLVTDDDGNPYFAQRVAAGGDAVARPLTDNDWSTIREFALDRILEPPDGLEAKDIAGGLWGDLPWRWHERTWQPKFREGLLERHLGRLLGQAPASGTVASGTDNNADAGREAAAKGDADEVRIDRAIVEDSIDPLAHPRGFLAVASENPGVDLGSLDVDERGSLHMLMGTW